MLSTEKRIALIYEKLTQAFHPLSLQVIDDSDEHHGHSGHGGAGHFTVVIVSPAFAGQSLVSRHRMIYTALQEMIGPEIHALSIEAKAPQT